MKAKKFDKKFDKGQSVVEHLDLANARRPRLEQKEIGGNWEEIGEEIGDRPRLNYWIVWR